MYFANAKNSSHLMCIVEFDMKSDMKYWREEEYIFVA